MPDYLAAFRADPEKDVKHHGVKGQRWGVRRSSAALAAAARSRGDSSAKKDSTEKKAAPSSGGTVKEKPKGDIQDRVESSSDRYDRITGTVKNGRASDLTEADLKFYNARTDALAKINKMNEQQPSWLKDTATKVIQQSAQRQMQGVADALADKYIGDPIKNALKGAADTAAVAKTVKAEETAKPKTSIKDAASKIADKVEAKSAESKTPESTTPKPSLADRLAASKKAKGDAQYEETQKKIAEKDAAAADNPRLLSVSDSVKYYKDNPTATPEPPTGLSPSGYRIWLDEVRKARGQ